MRVPPSLPSFLRSSLPPFFLLFYPGTIMTLTSLPPSPLPSLPPSLLTHAAFSLRLVVVFQNTSTCLVEDRFLAAAAMSLGREGGREGGRGGQITSSYLEKRQRHSLRSPPFPPSPPLPPSLPPSILELLASDLFPQASVQLE